jgi:hypothetical protein
MLTRRSFLARSAALAAGSAIGGYPLAALGAQCGSAWEDLGPLGPGGGRSSYKVLEIHFYGGLSPWETFYVRPRLDWRDFKAKIEAAQWSQAAANSLSLCRFSPLPTTSALVATKAFDTTHPDHEIHLGPATIPLWHDDILKRMRVVVLQHDLQPHEAAVPYAATGFRLGRPQMAGMGSLVQTRRSFVDGDRKTPTAFVCLSEAVAGADNMQAFWSPGQLGGGQPVVLKFRRGDGARAFLRRLQREHAREGNDTKLFDDLLTAYKDAYRGVIRAPLAGGAASIPLRSKGFAGYETALHMLQNAKELELVLGKPEVGFQLELEDSGCVVVPPEQGGGVRVNTTRMAMTTAAGLLSPQGGDADYACVVDNGLYPDAVANTGYDTHNERHVELTFANLYNAMASLRDLIHSKVLDLSTTLVMLSTEFGRTPHKTGAQDSATPPDGRDHWPQGYTAALIGGPIAPIDVEPPDAPFNPASFPRVLGRIDDAKGVAVDKSFFTATDVRAAAVLAAGICPFTGSYINQGDLSGKIFVKPSESHSDTLIRLRSTFFGRERVP